MHHFVLPKLRLVFLQRTRPIHLLRPKTKFLGGFARFCCREVQVVRSGFGVHKMHNFVLPKLRLVFSQRTCPIHFFRPKTMFLGGFARFRLVHCMHPKTRSHNLYLVATESGETTQKLSFGPKEVDWCIVCTPKPDLTTGTSGNGIA